MPMRNINRGLILVVLVALCGSPFWAQQSNPTIGATASSTPSTAPIPMTPISGAQTLAPTFGETRLSYVVPALACTEYATSNPSGYNQNQGLFSQTSCAGNVTLQKVGQHTQFNLDYTGGVFYYAPQVQQGNQTDISQFGTAHALGVYEQVNGARWNWMVGDQGTYLPESPMGFAGFAGLTSFGGGMGGSAISNAPALNPAFSPNQSIYGGLANRFSNLAMTEVSYLASPRSTFTGTAMFGTLQFLTEGYSDERYWIAMAGYNHMLSRADEVALAYQEMHFNFGAGQNLITRGASFLYGRTLNQHFTIQLSVAPMEQESNYPQTGTLRDFFVGTYDSLLYAGGRWNGSLTFEHVLTGGAGVLAGAELNMVRGDVGRQLSRTWHGSVNVGFSNNRALQSNPSANTRATYDYWQAGASLSHEFGPHISMYLNYEFARQTSNTNVCVGGACRDLYYRQMGGVGISWHARPIKIE